MWILPVAGNAFWIDQRTQHVKRSMDMTFDDMREFTAVYMEDIVVYSQSWDEPLHNILESYSVYENESSL